MISKWYELKDEAIKYRLDGNSIREIEKIFGVPRSTLSGWFRHINLPSNKKKILNNKWKKSLVKAREKAIVWHNTEKLKRIKIAENDAHDSLKKIDCNNKNTLELAIAMLYLGEGAKNGRTSIANSDPLILQFFTRSMEKLYEINRKNIKCELHLRADQNINEIRRYWSKQLNIPFENFISISIDKRSTGKKTYDGYKGVCVLNYGNIAIQRKLVYLSRKYCEQIRDK